MNNLKHKRGFFAVVLFFLILLVFLIIRLVFSVQASQKRAEIFLNFSEKQNEVPLYQEGEARDLSEDIFWLEQKLELAKSDSISLSIDLSDGLVQIHLKGMDLFHSKILKKYPENVLNSLNQAAYLQLAKVTEIKSEVANVPKKPIKKVKALKNGIPQAETEKDSIPNPDLIWHFVTGENIRIVITGVKMNSDSAFVINPRIDLMKYKTQEFLRQIIPSDYSPTVYLWLIDTDAKAIYRAVPEKGKVLFRN
jgi:hypothetical protein